MLGASAARHLADAGCDVVLVGAAEPVERGSRAGPGGGRLDDNPAIHADQGPPVYASHYDVARVSRIIDPDPTRAWLGHRSVDQFAAVAARTGVTAVNPVGHLWVEAPDGIDLVAASDQRFDLGSVRQSAAEAMGAFPYLSLGGGLGPDGLDSLWEPPPAGSVDPRAYVAAEMAAAVGAGSTHVVALVDSVTEVDGQVEVVTDAGTITADRVLLATGAFSGHGTTPVSGSVSGLTASDLEMARELDLEYALHTQLLVHLDAEEVNRLAGMPSIIGKFADPIDDFYLTPPVPDLRPGVGDRHILKVGMPKDDHVCATSGELAAWFRTAGDPTVAARLAGILARLLPGLRDGGRWTSSCVTTYTPSGFPFIDQLGDRVKGRTYCAIGGNGFAAKCAPALGELAAGLILGHDWPTEVDRELFLARFRD